MKMLSVLSIVVLVSSVALAQETPKDEPPPKMQPDQIGPRTEAVDEKAYAKVLHVAPGGSDQGDGSQAKPLASLAGALANTKGANAEGRYAILVAAGGYKGDTIVMTPYVDLFGGFDAKSWQRDIDANRSVLDGEGERRVAVGTNHARIDGFVIKNGKVRGPGAGILCDHTSPTITNNTIIGNKTLEPAGIDKKMIHQHGNDGAAIACMNGASPTIANNIIAGNSTELGGGAGISASNYSMPRVENNVITGNVTGLTDVNQSRSSNGAAISATNAQHRPPLRMAIINNVISHNRAQGKGDAGGIYLEYDSSPLIGSNWILGNWCEDDGSGIYVMKGSQPLFTGNVVAGNNSSAIRLSKEGRGDIENNVVFGNAAAVICISSYGTFKNNTIVDNASGVSYGNSYAPHLKPSTFIGNLIYNNRGGQLGAEANDEPPIVKNNDIQGGYDKGEGNFDQKPQFIDDGGEATAGSLKYDELNCVTILHSTSVTGDSQGALDGRVISGGDKWGVIKQADGDKIVVWGDLRSKDNQATKFKIWPTYQLRTALAGDVGSQLKP